MPRDAFEDRLTRLRADVAALGTDVVGRLDRATTAYERRDRDVGRAVATTDDAVNERYLALERECIDLLALYQPVASDLRVVVASFKILTDVERVADLAANLGGYVEAMESDTIPNVPIADIADMALAQLDGALTAYEDGDAERCREVAAADTDLDQRCGAAADDLVRTLARHSPADGDIEALLADTKVPSGGARLRAGRRPRRQRRRPHAVHGGGESRTRLLTASHVTAITGSYVALGRCILREGKG